MMPAEKKKENCYRLQSFDIKSLAGQEHIQYTFDLNIYICTDIEQNYMSSAISWPEQQNIKINKTIWCYFLLSKVFTSKTDVPTEPVNCPHIHSMQPHQSSSLLEGEATHTWWQKKMCIYCVFNIQYPNIQRQPKQDICLFGCLWLFQQFVMLEFQISSDVVHNKWGHWTKNFRT